MFASELCFLLQRKRKQSAQDEDAVSLCSLDVSVSTVLPTRLPWERLSSLSLFVNTLCTLSKVGF